MIRPKTQKNKRKTIISDKSLVVLYLSIDYEGWLREMVKVKEYRKRNKGEIRVETIS